MRIREVRAEDETLFYTLAEAFYHSSAVLHPVPGRVIRSTFAELMRKDGFLSAWFLEEEEETAGYALFSRGFSPEVGAEIVWLEQLYIRPAWRGRGLGKAFMAAWLAKRPAEVKRYRMEIEAGNREARALYAGRGFTQLPYVQMYRDFS